MAKVDGSAFVTLPDVSVRRVLDYALMCQIETHLRLIPREQLRDGSTIRQQGDVGVLVVPTAYAVEWGLVAHDSSSRVTQPASADVHSRSGMRAKG